MIVSSGNSVEPRTVNDYDFVFLNGVAWPITIDEEAGDSIDFRHDRVVIKLAPKASPNEGNTLGSEETTTIFMQNVIIVNHRKRSVIPPSVEQKLEMQQLMKKASKVVH